MLQEEKSELTFDEIVEEDSTKKVAALAFVSRSPHESGRADNQYNCLSTLSYADGLTLQLTHSSRHQEDPLRIPARSMGIYHFQIQHRSLNNIQENHQVKSCCIWYHHHREELCFQL